MPQTDIAEIGVQVSKDQMSAVLQIPAGYPADSLNTDLCIAQFEANHVIVDSQAQIKIQLVVEAFKKMPDKPQQVTITGHPPTTGMPGRLEMSEQCTQKPPEPTDPENGEPDGEVSPIDHYARSPYIFVKKDQIIGRLIPPTDGEDGRDVCGNSVASRPGKPFPLKPHESILVDAKNQIIAQLDGTLEQHDAVIRVNPVLNIPGRVDFETGNVDFDGDVVIGKGVCDNFKINVTQNAVINGVVEAAELHTGGDLVLTTGMFGKEKGTFRTGRDCRAKFLQQVQGHVNRNLIVDKEIVNSRLSIIGGVDSPRASLIGGTYHSLGKVELNVIGSESGIKTVLHMGSLPDYDRLLDAAVERLEKLQKTIDNLQRKLDMITTGSRTTTAQTKEELTEYTCEQMEAQEQFEKLKTMVDTMSERFSSRCKPEVTVLNMIHHDSVIVLGNTAAMFSKPVKGPISIIGTHRGELVYRQGQHGSTQPIRAIARMMHWD